MRRRERAGGLEEEEEEEEEVMLCTVQQLSCRPRLARDPSRKSSVWRSSTRLSRPSRSSISEPAAKWGSSQGKGSGEGGGEEEEEEAGAEEDSKISLRSAWKEGNLCCEL